MKRELWAIWGSKCWKCEGEIVAAMNTAGLTFNPYTESGEMWSDKISESSLKILERFGVKIELKYSKTLENKYMANVCPSCGAIQGDWFINQEFLDIMYDPPADFKLLLIDNGELVDTLHTIDEFEVKYLEHFLDNDAKNLKRCHICKCYISEAPASFEKYKKQEKTKTTLEKYGEIRQLIVHHISYKNNITIEVCPVCHAKIHHSKDPNYTKFKPIDHR